MLRRVDPLVEQNFQNLNRGGELLIPKFRFERRYSSFLNQGRVNVVPHFCLAFELGVNLNDVHGINFLARPYWGWARQNKFHFRVAMSTAESGVNANATERANGLRRARRAFGCGEGGHRFGRRATC